MKKIKYVLMLFLLTFVLTGCVKFNANMDIKKDKSMDFTIIYAIDTSVFGEESVLAEEDKKELESKGFTVADYSEDKMKGFTISKKIKNIDDVSSETDIEYSLSGIAGDKSDNGYIFKVKKGLLKNTYTANFKFDASDSDLNNNPSDENSSNDETNIEVDSEISKEEIEELPDEEEVNIEPSNATNEEEVNIVTSTEPVLGTEVEDSLDLNNGNDADISSLMSGMDLSFNVTLPYSAKSSNASTKSNDDKNLSWNLSTEQKDAIRFEFDIYNMTNIYIGVGAIALLAIVVIIIIASKKKKNNSEVNNTIATQNVESIVNAQEPVESVLEPVQNIQEPVESVQEPVESVQEIQKESVVSTQSDSNTNENI